MARTKKAAIASKNKDNAEIVINEIGDKDAVVSPKTDMPQTPKIVIDGVEYEATNLSDAAKGAIASLQFAEAKIMALQNELAVCQTARFAYVKGLKTELEGKTTDA